MSTQDSGLYSTAIRQNGIRLGVNEPLVATGSVALPSGSLVGAIGIYSGAGVPSLSAPKGSIYSNTTASAISTRLYVNTDGATTWTAVTTAA